ncbi:MAG TPA: radical SAM protein [Thermodesulfovibrionales bacterium]|nr:radical SAM protein [Thermodesulfovibrionales bacterium]
MGILVRRVGIETGRRCNLRCIYCFADSGKPISEELTTREILSIIDQAREAGAGIIPVIGGGEPTLNKDLLDIVAYISDKGMVPGVFTNCVMITKQTARRLFELGSYVVGKLNSLDHDTEDFMTGVKGASKKIKRGIEILQETGFASTNPSRLSMNTIICKYNYDEIPRIFRWLRDNDIIPYMQLPVIVGRAAGSIAVSDDQAKDLFYRILDIDRREYGFDWIPTPPNIGWSCTQRTTSCYITSTGDIKLCNSTDIRFGNIRHDRLRDVLISSRMRAMRDLSKVHGNCAKCPYLGVHCCAGCGANTFNATQDEFASDDRCWHKWHA